MTPHRRAPVVEILYFDGCPNCTAARELVVRVAGELGVEPDLRLVEVTDDAGARRLRFLGSPTIRVDGRDVEPGADSRNHFALSCRVYRGGEGVRGQQAEAWVRAALSGP